MHNATPMDSLAGNKHRAEKVSAAVTEEALVDVLSDDSGFTVMHYPFPRYNQSR